MRIRWSCVCVIIALAIALPAGCTTPLSPPDAAAVDAPVSGMDALERDTPERDTPTLLDVARCTGATCTDDNPCTRDECVGGSCRYTPDDALAVDDGNICNGAEVCRAGAVVPGAPLDCADAYSCTIDTCDPDGGCVSTPNDALCTLVPGGRCDADTGCQYPSCTAATCAPASACETASCTGDTCVRTPVCSGLCCGGACCVDDANPCTTVMCGVSGCNQVNNSAACDDGNACTSGDVCAGGACTGVPVSCDDRDSCTADTCTGGVCSNVFRGSGTSCDDGNPCTAGDVCSAGGCNAGTLLPSGTRCGGAIDPITCRALVCDGTGLCRTGSVCPGGTSCCGDATCAAAGAC